MPSKPVILCVGSLEAEADSRLGTRTEDYDTVTRSRRTGKELERVSHHETHDDRRSSLYEDAAKKLAARVKAELGLGAIE